MIINNLVVADELDEDKDVCVDIARGSDSAYLTKEEAFELMQHLVKVFEFSAYEIGGLQ
jgi:hypothetical protein